MEATVTAESPETPENQAALEPTPKRDWSEIAQKMVQSPYFIPGAILTLLFGYIFWPLLAGLPQLWMGEDGYYTHGFLVPFISGFLVYKAWPTLKQTPMKPVMWPVIFLPLFFWIAYAARLAELRSVTSVIFVLTILIGILFLFGGKWFAKLAPAACYLIFALPFWSFIINNYTNPLQIYSTKVALKMLEMFYDPLQTNSTTILVGHFWLDVGVPCSGLKLVLAITAFTCFFMLIGGLKWWGNFIMVLFILPLCLFINGLRIAMIGAVGEAYGDQAGHTFHDYSGYLTLIVCFFILFRLARILGWKG